MILKSQEQKRLARNARQRAWRKRTAAVSDKRYHKTVNGFLMRAYRNMESRVKGIQKNTAHLYAGLELLDRKTFYAWAKADPEFKRLWDVWESTGRPRYLTPSIDRINPSLGYTLDNMQWLTAGQNSAKANIQRTYGAGAY